MKKYDEEERNKITYLLKVEHIYIYLLYLKY